MNKIKLLIAIMFLQIVSAEAAVQKYKYNEEKIVKATVAKGVQNRIRVEGDRIKEVIGLSEGYFVESDKSTGQIFIIPQNFEENASTFSIITEKGKTQDITITPKVAKEASTLIIEMPEEVEFENIITGASHRRHEDIVEIIKKVAKELSAGKVKKRNNDWIGLKDMPIDSRLVLEKKAGIMKLEVWEIKDKSLNKVMLNEKDFIHEQAIAAIAIEKMILEPGEVTNLYRLSYVK